MQISSFRNATHFRDLKEKKRMIGRVRIDHQSVPGSVASQKVDSCAHNSSRPQYLTCENVIVHLLQISSWTNFLTATKIYLTAAYDRVSCSPDTRQISADRLQPPCLAAQSGETRMFIHDVVEI